RLALVGFAEALQLGLGAQLELADALAADAEPLAQRSERGRPLAQMARLDDHTLARVEHLQAFVEPRAPLEVLLVAGHPSLGRRTVDCQRAAHLAAIVGVARRIERDVASVETRRHLLHVPAIDAEHVSNFFRRGCGAGELELAPRATQPEEDLALRSRG